MRCISVVTSFAFVGLVAPFVVAGCHRTNGDAETSGQHVGESIRDAGGKAIEGVKQGGEKTGAWFKGLGEGLHGDA
jgi:hypothetical protein